VYPQHLCSAKKGTASAKESQQCAYPHWNSEPPFICPSQNNQIKDKDKSQIVYRKHTASICGVMDYENITEFVS
jgi:hypothetical protein